MQPQQQPPQDRPREDHDEDRMPRNIDPLRTNMPGRRDMNGLQRVNVGGQPDPTRTSIDSMGAGRRGGGGGGNRRGGGGGGNGARAPSRFAR
jgi:ATP-dependent RNA helicase RhlE